MNEKMKKYLELLSQSKELNSAIDNDELAAMAKELNIKPNDTDFKPACGELSDDALDAISGGVSDEIYLDEVRMPLGWYVTCTRCTMGFQVAEGSCPVCGGMEVWPGTDRAIAIYNPNMW